MSYKGYYDNKIWADVKPCEFDVVQLLRALPEYDLPVGSRGTVVMEYGKYSNQDLPPDYEVEFADLDGATLAVVTVSGNDLEVVWRMPPRSRP